MADQFITKAAFAELIDVRIADRAYGTVIGVVSRKTAFAFEPLRRAADLRLDYGVTLMSPKYYLQPPREDLFRFTRGATPTIEPVPAGEPMLFVGVHPYDMIAINQADALFSDANADGPYLRRRASTTIICSNIQQAGPRAFANQMGATRVDRGYDLFITDIGKGYVVQVGTEKGRALLRGANGVVPADEKQLKHRNDVLARTDALYGENALDGPAARYPELLRPDQALDHPVWEEKSSKCYSCGSCNTVCPTCVCFDVRDEVVADLASGVRFRTWGDGCLLTDFAKVGTGENFRHKRIRRYQHRFYRKFLYLHERYKSLYCVGCGRCVTACLPDIANPVAIYNALAKGESSGGASTAREPKP